MHYAKHATKIAASSETAKRKMLKDVKIPEIRRYSDTLKPNPSKKSAYRSL